MDYKDITALVKQAKNLLARAQRYEDAVIVRELEAIMETDGTKLTERSLTAMCEIINQICKKKQ